VRRFGKRTTCCAAISLFDDKISGTSVYAGSSTEIPPVTFKKTSLVSQIRSQHVFLKLPKHHSVFWHYNQIASLRRYKAAVETSWRLNFYH
jgi:hypothetical protein